jgi:hypothetical protein
MGVIKYLYIILFLPIITLSHSDVELILTKDVNCSHYNLKTPVDSSDFLSFLRKKRNFQKTYRVALLLPFCVDSNQSILNINIDSIISVNPNKNNLSFYKKSQISIDFYLGFLMSLRKFENYNIEISLFDIKENDVSKQVLNDIIDTQYLDNMDFVIGPLFSSNFKYFADRFNSDIPLISPLSKKDYIIDDNDNTFQIQSNVNNYFSLFSEYIFRTHRKDNILLVRRDTILDTIKNINAEVPEYIIDTILPFDINYSDFLLEDIDTSLFNFREIKVANNIIDSIHHELDTLGMKNIVIIGSEDNVFVTDLLSKLHACRDTNMVVYGLPAVSEFDHLSVFDLMDMQFTFPDNKFHSDSLSTQFIMDFYDNYNYVPRKQYASVGYELGLYFLNILVKNGSIFPYVSLEGPQRVLETIYHFKKIKNGGYKNQGVILLRFDDFQYKRIY